MKIFQMIERKWPLTKYIIFIPPEKGQFQNVRVTLAKIIGQHLEFSNIA